MEYKQDAFISYARSDDEPFVRRLFRDLTERQFRVWRDRECMPSRSLTFSQEIRDAIDGSARMVAVVGPAALTSEYVRAEWEWAQLFGNGVIPVLRIGDFDGLPPELSRIHAIDMRSDERSYFQGHTGVPRASSRHSCARSATGARCRFADKVVRPSTQVILGSYLQTHGPASE